MIMSRHRIKLHRCLTGSWERWIHSDKDTDTNILKYTFAFVQQLNPTCCINCYLNAKMYFKMACVCVCIHVRGYLPFPITHV